MLYSCVTINIENKWLFLGIVIYMGGRSERAQLGTPTCQDGEVGMGRTGSWSTAAQTPQSQMRLKPSPAGGVL